MQRMQARTSGMIHWTESGKHALCSKRIKPWFADYPYQEVNCPKCLVLQVDNGEGIRNVYQDTDTETLQRYARQGSENAKEEFEARCSGLENALIHGL